MPPFCNDPGVWGPFTTTNPPDFTPCFRNIVLSALPLALLAVGAVVLGEPSPGVEGNGDGVRRSVVRLANWAWLLKTLASLAAFLSIAVRLHSATSSSETVLDCISLVSILLVIFAQRRDHRRGVRVNAMTTTFWLWKITTAAVYLRSLVLQSVTSGVEFHSTVAIIASSTLVLAFDEFLPLQKSHAADSNARDNAGALSLLTWSYIFGKLRKGVSTTLTFEDDVWPIPPLESSAFNAELFERYYDPRRVLTTWGLFAILMKAQYRRFCTATFLKTVAGLLLVVQPILLDYLIDFVQSWQPATASDRSTPQPQPLSTGLLIVTAMLLVGVASSLTGVWGNDKQWNLYYRWKTAMVALIFRKSLHLSPDARAKYDSGAIINLVDNDAIQVGFLGTNLPEIIGVVIQIVSATVLLWQRLSYATLVAMIGLLALGPAQARAGDMIGNAADKQYEAVDTRISLTSEVIKAMRVIKFYCWESIFVDKIQRVRKTELGYLAKGRLGEAFVCLLSNLCPILILAASLAGYILIAPEDAPLDANRIFVSLAIFNLLRVPLTEVSMSIPPVFRSIACMARCIEFLNSPSATPYIHSTPSTSPAAIKVTDGTFTWSASSAPALPSLTLSIARSSLVGVVGKVGSGKSSILSALLGDMIKVAGEVEMGGDLVYVSQTPWLFNASVRENILLGRGFEERWYKEVVEACALADDFAALPAGDATEVKGRGGNLSGGQKQRISLARAVYARSAIYLIDDTLSGVDSHVGRHIFDRVLGPDGLLKDTTRVFVTHSVQYLNAMDRVIVVDAGRVVEDGTYDGLISEGRKMAEIIAIHEEHQHADSSAAPGKNVSNPSSASETSDATAVPSEGEADSTLPPTDAPPTGRVSLHHFAFYIRACTYPLFLLFLFSVAAAEAINLGSRYWLMHWSLANETTPGVSQWPYLATYIAWLAAYCLVYAFASIFFLWYISPRAAAVIHHLLLTRVVRMPMGFFDTTPLGRILTRFQANVSSVDTRLPDEVYDVMFGLASVGVSLVPAVVNTPMLIGFVGVSVGILSFTLIFYLGASLAYTRMKLTTEADHLTHIDEVLSGLSTIKVFNRLSHETTRNASLYDNLQRALLSYYYTNRWFSLWIQLISSLLTFAAAMFAVTYRSSLSAASIGLSISTLLSLGADLATITMRFGMFQNDVVALERINGYVHLPVETPDEDYAPVEATWPATGAVSYVDVSLRYRAGLPLVLRNVSFDIKNGERVGVVGRTGAGKSSLIQSLLRLVELAENDNTPLNRGFILVAGRDIAQVPLPRLRASMVVIAQESFLFQGSLRENLDPTGTAPDSALWLALAKVSLNTYISTLEGKLDFSVQPSGDNLSQGQRQLLSLARVLITHLVRGGVRIVVLDEATASVDVETDRIVQRVIREEFRGVTVVTIAHRLHTVLDSDRVLVLEKGAVVEFDDPRVLMRRRTSVLYAMVHGRGVV
ncbi:P-loop containing nucleoside triphosphate hydrolase protein [Fimicolochytrium jonesii]|uniref:P-loop containing nucleoside triphosphate hydrolase protein n=1 Tax=Fimicolochytrium jonesii TaxID=1396493 RepID=UPI0022FE21FB|nr:P-loop containing nucleoside triphosphate hydrolase protein [Fimicolochytrium jonesii]KAI8815898.1 P-loop containing nucleoside triphosphate hydrolase protein [Fimicolochytrium jonesii]